MKIPNSKRDKALIIIDVQSAFLSKRNRYIVSNIEKLMKGIEYKLYVETVFHAENGTIWEVQTKWTLPKDKDFHTINKLIAALGKNSIHIEKTTRSVFKGNIDLLKILKSKKIKEVHIVGLQTNSCIITTALESFDYGFSTYVIEECCQSDKQIYHEAGLKILRSQNLTNNSCIEDLPYKKV